MVQPSDVLEPVPYVSDEGRVRLGVLSGSGAAQVTTPETAPLVPLAVELGSPKAGPENTSRVST
jgi:hypothetical protein